MTGKETKQSSTFTVLAQRPLWKSTFLGDMSWNNQRIKRVFEPQQLSRPFSGNAEWKRFYREGDGFQRPKRTAREREKPPQKRERVISPHPASFLFTHKLSLSGLCPSLFFLFLYYPSRLNLALLLPIPFPFSLSSQLASSHLQPHLLYLLRPGEGGTHIRDGPSFQKIPAIRR